MLTRSKRLLDHVQIARFGAVGLINTLIGYLAILSCLSLGAGDLAANALGYAAGLIVSYLLNSIWTFRGPARVGRSTASRYVVVFLVAYAANLAIVLVGRGLGYQENPLIHLAGIGIYATVFYAGAARFVFDQRPLTAWRSALARFGPELAVLALLAAAWLTMRHIPITHDVVWQMWIARQMLGGAHLYFDILELNPPLWFWLAVPVEKSAQWLGLVPQHAMIAAVFGYAAVAQLALAALIADFSLGRRAALLTVALGAMIIVPIPDFAQREHLAMIAAIPYCALAARRAEGRRVPWRLAAAVGLLSALGFALKHYFVLIPVLIELWLLWKHRRAWQAVRPETLTLAGAAVLYIGAIFVATPQYFSIIVPMLKLAYFGYEASWPSQVIKSAIVFWMFAATVLWALRKGADALTITSIIAAAGFILSYFMQQKGWNYHTMPASGMLLVSLGSLSMVEHRGRAPLGLLALAIIMPMLIAVTSGPYKNKNEGVIADLLRGTERGQPVMMLAANPSRLWPMNENGGYTWPSRHFAFWMLAAFAHELRRGEPLSPDMQQLAREIRAQTVVDLECNPPEVILVDDLIESKARGIDAVAFFSEDGDFRKLFANYDVAGARANFTKYVKHPGWQPAVRPASCRVLR